MSSSGSSKVSCGSREHNTLCFSRDSYDVTCTTAGRGAFSSFTVRSLPTSPSILCTEIPIETCDYRVFFPNVTDGRRIAISRLYAASYIVIVVIVRGLAPSDTDSFRATRLVTKQLLSGPTALCAPTHTVFIDITRTTQYRERAISRIHANQSSNGDAKPTSIYISAQQ